jgi:hypothetical protein
MACPPLIKKRVIMKALMMQKQYIPGLTALLLFM